MPADVLEIARPTSGGFGATTIRELAMLETVEAALFRIGGSGGTGGNPGGSAGVAGSRRYRGSCGRTRQAGRGDRQRQLLR